MINLKKLFHVTTFIIGIVITIFLVTCDEKEVAVKPLVEKVLTADEQAALTPDEVTKLLQEGNQRFIKNDLTLRNHSAQVRKSSTGQFPKAIILSCIDSRIPVEDIFDRGIGDIFVVRIAGNIVNEDILGSLEFACKVSGIKLILVLGHNNCGAIKSAVDDVELGNITALLSRIKPAIELASDYLGEKSSKNAEYVQKVCLINIENSIQAIREGSSILNEMEQNGEIKMVGAIYNLNTGEVNLINE